MDISAEIPALWPLFGLKFRVLRPQEIIFKWALRPYDTRRGARTDPPLPGPRRFLRSGPGRGGLVRAPRRGQCRGESHSPGSSASRRGGPSAPRRSARDDEGGGNCWACRDRQ